MMDRRGEPHVIGPDTWPALLEGDVEPAEKARVEAHLASCPACRQAAAEWAELRGLLRAYAPPPEPPGADKAFWLRLRPRLARQGPDPAPILTPLALAVAHALWQGAVLGLGAFGLFGGWRLCSSLLQSTGAAQVLSALLRNVSAASWWGRVTGWASPWLSQGLPEGWAGALWPLGLAMVGFWGVLALVLVYVAWMYLWLRRPVDQGA